MDRPIVYPGSIPLDTDVLRAAQNAMVAFGSIAAAMLGTGTVVDGLACSPSGLAVQVGPGAIFQSAPLEATPYGSLPADTADSIVKCGINSQTTTTATLTPPGSVGQAINYLIEAQLQEADTGATVLPYYNAANPSVAYSGPGGGGAAQNTLRTQRVSLQVKAGAAATTGSQATPGADAGWTPLWIVTVNAGAVAVTPGNIAPHPLAPFVPTKLAQQRRRLTAPLTLYVATTGNDANSGLTAWNAFASKQAAVNYIYNALDLNGFSVTVNVAAGAYTDPVTVTGLPIGAPGIPIAFLGASGVTIGTSNASCFLGQNGASFSVSNMALNATGTGTFQGSGIASVNGAIAYIGNGVAFGTCAAAHMTASGGEVALPSPNVSYYISGNAAAHLYSLNASSLIAVAGATINCISGAPYAFSTAFAVAGTGGQLAASGITFLLATAITGPRFLVNNGGIINTNGAGANYFPGNSAGFGSSFGAAPYGLYL